MKLLARLMVLLGVLFFALSVPVYADGMIIPRPLPDNPKPPNLVIKYHRVNIEVKDQVAVVKVDQMFRNDYPRDLEGDYIFPLPEEAAISKFAMDVDGKMVEGKILDRDQARAIYEEIVRRRKDPALLEYVGRNMFRARVFPIPRNGEKRIGLQYSEILKAENGVVKLTYPLDTERLSPKPLQELTVTIKVNSKIPLKAFYCPSHQLHITRVDEGTYKASFERTNVTPDKDLIVYYTLSEKDFGVNLIPYREAGEKEGYFILLIAPKKKVSEREVIPKEVVFVTDTSGSMADEKKLVSVKKALNFCLQNLGKRDKFNIVAFSDEIDTLAREMLPVTSNNITKATNFVDRLKPEGGTNIDDAILQGLKIFSRNSAAGYLVFLTDGLPTVGKTEVEDILKDVKSKNFGIRIYTFGVGNDVNTILLDQLANQNKGISEYLKPGEDMEVKITAFYRKIAAPLVSDVELDLGKIQASQIYPRPLPDIFRGSQLVVTGKYYIPGHVAIRLLGKSGKVALNATYEVNFPEVEESNTFVPSLWATRRIGYLLEEIRLKGKSTELIDEVIRLSKKYGIITPYTSFLVEEPKGPRPSGVEQLHRLEESEARQAMDKVSALPSAPASGAGAVRSSKMILGFKYKETPIVEHRQIKNIEGKTFYLKGNIWVDADYKGQKTRKIRFGSPEYFDLSRKNKALARYFSLGERVVVVYQGTSYEVEP